MERKVINTWCPKLCLGRRVFERHFKRLRRRRRRRRRRKATRRMQCPAAKEEVGKGNRFMFFFLPHRASCGILLP